MKPALLLLSAVCCWFAVPQGRCSEQTLSSQDKQLVTDSNEVDSQSSSSSGIPELVPVSAAPHESGSAECVSCRDCVVSDSCPADSLSSAACDHQLTLPSFPAGQENASVRETRKPAKDRSRKRSNASLVLRDQASSDSDPSVSGRDQEIPTFDEWTKIMMETEKSQVTPQAPDGQKLQQTVTNYASVECGAKILSSNPEAKSTSAVLMENMDMYMLNPCNNKIWFIIELCQPIQVKQLDIANFEIFSSNPRDFLVSISDRYPNKKWVKLGTFHARDERTVQSFPLDEHLFAKFVKVELLSHFGSEHFCPLSLIRVFGTSMMEEYELNSEPSDGHTHTPDEQDYGQTPDFMPVDDKSSANLIGSAKDALLTMVNNIAANVLGGQGAGNSSTAALNASEGALPAGVEHSGPEADQPDDPEAASRSHTDAPHTEDAPGRAEPEPEQIVTLLPEDEPDQTPGAGLGQSERTADTERSHDLSLLEYLLQRCPSPQKRKSSRSMSSVTESPVAPSELQPVEWALAPSLTSDLLLPADPEPPISEGLPATLPPLSPESADRPDPDPLVDLVPSSGDPETGSGPEDASAPAAEDPLITLTPEGPLEPAEARGKELLEDELEGDSEGPAQGSGQKESVFMRLNNRIKALEMNMSLSGRYLEQLSQRYRKQVEEMQRAFNKTVIKLQNTSRTAEEQDQRQTDSIQGLQAQLENVTQLVLRLSVSVSRLQHEVSDRQSYILLCLILCVLLALLICVNYRQMCESPALDTLEREPLSDEGPLILGRRASEPPSLSSLQTPEGGSEETSSLKQCPVSRKKKHKLKLSRSLEARAAPPAPGVIPQITIGPQGSEVREAVSDGSEGSSHSEETLFCGFSSCTRLCETKPAPRRWTQSGRQKTPEQLHQPPQRSQPYDLTSGHTDRWTH